ncbi:precursor of cep12, partial [Quercus suber]
NKNLSAIVALRLAGIHPPTIPRGSLSKPKPPSTGWFTINRYKMVEINAFRPTTPGHSPGVGHDHPPVAI